MKISHIRDIFILHFLIFTIVFGRISLLKKAIKMPRGKYGGFFSIKYMKNCNITYKIEKHKSSNTIFAC